MGVWWVLRDISIYKVTPDIDFTDEVVVQCGVPDVKVPF